MTTIHAKFNVQRSGFDLQVDLNIPAHGVTAFYGHSGCGKTTLLRAIAGLEHHRDGFLKIDRAIWQNEKLFVPPHQRSVGYVFQEPSLFPHLTVRRNLEYGYKRLRHADRKVSFDNAVELLGLSRLLNRKPSQLSGGERQRVAIGRALTVSPQLLLMDEPLSALDAASKQEILPYLESLRTELSVPLLYVSHTIEEVARLADTMVVLDRGRVTAQGTAQDILTRLNLSHTHDNDAASILDGTVAGHDEPYQLTYIKCGKQQISVPYRKMKIGSPVRLRLNARDISIALERPSHSSILNIFPATVDQLTSEGASQTLVRLLFGDKPILSRITRKSASLLELQTGKPVFVQVKSVSLLN